MLPVKLLFLDVETTGIPCPDSGLIQLSGTIEVNGEPRETFDFRIKPFPGDVVSDEALAVNGVTREELANFQEPEAAFQAFVELLGRFVDPFDRTDKFHLVAYNAPFDVQHLRTWFEKNGDQYFGSWFWHPAVDVMGLAVVVLMDRRAAMKDFKLATVAEAMGLHVDDSQVHDAAYDVELTRRLFLRITQQAGIPYPQGSP